MSEETADIRCELSKDFNGNLECIVSALNQYDWGMCGLEWEVYEGGIRMESLFLTMHYPTLAPSLKDDDSEQRVGLRDLGLSVLPYIDSGSLRLTACQLGFSFILLSTLRFDSKGFVELRTNIVQDQMPDYVEREYEPIFLSDLYHEATSS